MLAFNRQTLSVDEKETECVSERESVCVRNRDVNVGIGKGCGFKNIHSAFCVCTYI